MTEFTPLTSLIGGMLIGLSAVILMATHGRIAGISGIVARLLPPKDETSDLSGTSVSMIFVLGLLLGVPAYWVVSGGFPEQTVSSNLPLLALAGLFVGFGATLGSGCTSGHGVCGLSRFSARSLVATGTFMIAAAITVFVLRHILGG